MSQWATMSKPERVERVTALMADGHSGGQVAALLGTTRAAICGFAYREGIKREARARMTDAERAERKALRKPPLPRGPRPKMITPLAAIAPPPPRPRQSTSLTIFDLRDTTCRFPLWSHTDRPRRESSLYCGAACAPADPYCTHHLQLTETKHHAPVR